MKTTNNVKSTLMPQIQQHTDAATLVAASPATFKDFAFPLNVYAHALLLQEGNITYLHYGLFQHDTTDIQIAQQYATDLLLSRLPPPPCRILEVGSGVGTACPLLAQQGYHIQGITPDAQQVAYIHQQPGLQTAITCQRLEDFEAEAASFDVVLLQESAQPIEPLVIFNKALDSLDASGRLLIMDAFALKYNEAGLEKLHLLEDMVTLAERFGFELVEQLDLSTMAMPTLDYLLAITAVHRQRLIKDLALSDATLTQLDVAIRACREKYTREKYGYVLLHFKKKSPPKWRLRLLGKDQAPEMLDLFERTFKHRMTPATWQWKYGTGAGRELGVWRDNQLIAHYGGISRNILFFGQPQTAIQIGDVIVDASERGVLTKKGPFFLMAATFLERYIGYGKPYLVGFGFPNDRAMKVAERHGLYGEVGQMIEITWSPLKKLPQWRTRLQLVNHTHNERIALAVNKCWQQMANDLHEALIGVRDWHYLQHRYLNHPSQHYQVVLVKNRFGERIRGVLVLRHDADGSELVDIVAALAEIPLLIIHARRLAGINHAKRLFCRITENFAPHFAIAGGVKQALNIRIPANTWCDGPSLEVLKNRWWLMSGDTDFR